MPDWVKEALCQRLELLTVNAEMLHDVLHLKTNSEQSVYIINVLNGQ
ncbi:Uncharacterised protein [Paenibacillus thiaminolyticus]|nr:Uncharacterised protein [Paenibacillus thiaminolyticus]